MEVAHIDAFLADPVRVWEFYARRLDALGAAEPNDGHRALAELEERGWIRAVVTQNVDGLHARAGSRALVEVHGSLRAVRCLHCGARTATDELVAACCRRPPARSAARSSSRTSSCSASSCRRRRSNGRGSSPPRRSCCSSSAPRSRSIRSRRCPRRRSAAGGCARDRQPRRHAVGRARLGRGRRRRGRDAARAGGAATGAAGARRAVRPRTPPRAGACLLRLVGQGEDGHEAAVRVRGREVVADHPAALGARRASSSGSAASRAAAARSRSFRRRSRRRSRPEQARARAGAGLPLAVDEPEVPRPRRVGDEAGQERLDRDPAGGERDPCRRRPGRRRPSRSRARGRCRCSRDAGCSRARPRTSVPAGSTSTEGSGIARRGPLGTRVQRRDEGAREGLAAVGRDERGDRAGQPRCAVVVAGDARRACRRGGSPAACRRASRPPAPAATT